MHKWTYTGIFLSVLMIGISIMPHMAKADTINEPDLINKYQTKYPNYKIEKEIIYDNIVGYWIMESENDSINFEVYSEEEINGEIILTPAYDNAWISPEENLYEYPQNDFTEDYSYETDILL